MGESTLRGPASFRAHAVRLIPPLQIRGHSGTAMMIDFSCEDHDMMKTRRRMVVIKSLLPISAQPHPFLLLIQINPLCEIKKSFNDFLRGNFEFVTSHPLLAQIALSFVL